jgi:hypothetical protein
MSSAQPVRFKESGVQIYLDGKKLDGDFENITSFTITPRAEFVHVQYAGDERERADIEIKGYDFTFELNESSTLWLATWKKYEDADRVGRVFPNGKVIATPKYRETGQPIAAVLFGDLLLKLDNRSQQSGQFVRQTWSGTCQRMQ